MEVGITEVWIITQNTESVPNLLIVIPQVEVVMDNANKIHVIKTLSPSLEHHQFITQLVD